MVYLLLATLISFIIYGVANKKINFLVFNTIWAFSILINKFLEKYIEQPSTFALFCVFVFIFSVNLGMIFGKPVVLRYEIGNKKKNPPFYKLANKRYLLVYLLVLSYFFYKYTIKSIEITNQYGVFYTRYYAFTANENFFGSVIDLYIAQQFLYAFFYSSMLVSIAEIVQNPGDKKKWIHILGFFGMILYAYTFKGRSAVVSILVYSLFAFIVVFGNTGDKSIKKRKEKAQKILFPLLFAVGLYVIILSLTRFGGFSQVKEFLIIYFGGPTSYLSILLEKAKISYIPGRFIFSGLFDFIKLGFNVIFKTNFLLGGNEIGAYIDSATVIGTGLSINAMCSSVFFFYLEFGIIGIIVYGVLFGWLSSALQLQYNKNKNPITLISYIVSLFVLFYSYSGWAYKYFYFWLIPVIVRFFYVKKDSRLIDSISIRG